MEQQYIGESKYARKLRLRAEGILPQHEFVPVQPIKSAEAIIDPSQLVLEGNVTRPIAHGFGFFKTDRNAPVLVPQAVAEAYPESDLFVKRARVRCVVEHNPEGKLRAKQILSITM